MDQMQDAPRRNDVSPAEWEARVDLAGAHRMAAINRWTDLIFNHFTVRVPDEPDHFLIKRHKLFFEEVTASNLVKVNLEGEPVGMDNDVNLAGFVIHSAVYKARPDVNAVMHVHSQRRHRDQRAKRRPALPLPGGDAVLQPRRLSRFRRHRARHRGMRPPGPRSRSATTR